QPNTLRFLVTRSQRQWRVGHLRQPVQVARAHLCRAAGAPPSRHEAAPHRTVGIGRLNHLVEIAEESFDTSYVEHATYDLRPGFVAPDGRRTTRPSGSDPGATKGKTRGDKARRV